MAMELLMIHVRFEDVRGTMPEETGSSLQPDIAYFLGFLMKSQVYPHFNEAVMHCDSSCNPNLPQSLLLT